MLSKILKVFPYETDSKRRYKHYRLSNLDDTLISLCVVGAQMKNVEDEFYKTIIAIRKSYMTFLVIPIQNINIQQIFE